jgi:hypothetical protein
MWTPLGLITSQGMTIKSPTINTKLTFLYTFISYQKWQFSQPWGGLFFLFKKFCESKFRVS